MFVEHTPICWKTRTCTFAIMVIIFAGITIFR